MLCNIRHYYTIHHHWYLAYKNQFSKHLTVSRPPPSSMWQLPGLNWEFGKQKKMIHILEQFQWRTVTYYSVLLDNKLINNWTKNLRCGQIHKLLKILLKYISGVDYLNFVPFLDYPTLYPSSMPITLKWGVLPYCGSPDSGTVHCTHGNVPLATRILPREVFVIISEKQSVKRQFVDIG